MANLTGHNPQMFIRLEIAPPTGSTTVLGDYYDLIVFTNPGTIAAQTLVLPATPVDGHMLYISNFAAITALTFSPSVSGWTDGATLAAGNGMILCYSKTLATPGWFVCAA